MPDYWDQIRESVNNLPISDEVKPWLILVLPLSVTVIASLYVLFRNYLFANSPINLQSPGERRRIERIAYIESLLEGEFNSDENGKGLLLEERNSLTFEHLYGIKGTKPYMREELQGLHNRSNSFVDWRAIRTAYPALREENFKLVRGLRIEDRISGALAIFTGLLVLLLGIIAVLGTILSPDDNANSTVAWVLLLLFSLVSILPLSLATPMIRAWQLGKWLPRKEEVRDDNSASNSN